MFDEMMAEYDRVYGRSIRGEQAYNLRSFEGFLIDYSSAFSVIRFSDLFSVMFWRLYKNGDRVTGINFNVPSLQRFGGDMRAEEFETELNKVHRHDFIELSYLYKGSFSQTINGERHEFHEGDVWIMDRNCLHGEHLLGYDSFVVFLEIQEDYFNETFLESFPNNAASEFIRETISARKSQNRFIKFTGNQESCRITKTLEAIIREKQDAQPGMEHVIKGLFIRLLYLLALGFTSELVESERNKHGELMLEEIERYVRERNGAVNLDELSSRYSYCKAYFSRLVKSKLNATFLDFIQEVRLDSAKALMADTDMSIADISEAVGYSNKSYFYRLFKEKIGMSPQDYRTENSR